MKKLSIEEKAKAYDEALKEAVIAHKDEDRHPKATLERIFQELKESEDESMIQYFKDLAPFDKAYELYEKYGFSHKDAIAWLEKQCVYDKFINGIQVGDKVTRNEDGVLVNLSQLNRVANKQGEQKLLYVNDNAKEMFIKALERVEEQNKKGYKLTDCDKNSWWEDFKAYTSCIIEQKPASWSKEDEKQARQIERIVHDDGCTQKLQKQIADWFESLKERYTWKPSEEQMNTLEYYMHTLICNVHKEVLFGLYSDLKKLREEEVMKANEAPDKLYIDLFKGEFNVSYFPANNSIEYVHTDSFIEKACEFMCNNIDKQLTIYHNNTWRKRDEFIEAFRQFMKEEKV